MKAFVKFRWLGKTYSAHIVEQSGKPTVYSLDVEYRKRVGKWHQMKTVSRTIYGASWNWGYPKTTAKTRSLIQIALNEATKGG